MNYNEFPMEEDFFEEDSLLDDFVLPPDIEEKRVVLQIMDAGGNIEDIIFDIEEIYKYVKNLYEKCPERN